MADHEVHVMREQAEHSLRALRDAHRLLHDAREALADSREGATNYERAVPELIIAEMTRAIDAICSQGRRIKKLLDGWKIPPMPPLDFTNIPDVLTYDAGTGKLLTPAELLAKNGPHPNHPNADAGPTHVKGE